MNDSYNDPSFSKFKGRYLKVIERNGRTIITDMDHEVIEVSGKLYFVKNTPRKTVITVVA